MKVLVFDTETTGLPADSSLSAFRSPGNWPHLVSISWCILDSVSNSIIKTHCFIIKPETWTISEEVSKIHGITQAQALEFGMPLRYVLELFNGEQYDLMVAHNMHFDHNVLVNAILWDLNIPFNGFSKRRECTMLQSRTMCRIPTSRGGFKFPKLKELYEFVVGKPPKNDFLHNALYDTLYLCEIIQKSPEIRIRLGITVIQPNNENIAVEPKDEGTAEAAKDTGCTGNTGSMV